MLADEPDHHSAEIEMVANAILAELEEQQREGLAVVHHRCAVRLRSKIPKQVFQAAVSTLEATGDLTLFQGDRVQRSEPDWLEIELEGPVERKLNSSDFLERLQIQPDLKVFQRTATGGAAATGKFSRPDFTLATIRRMKYDPLRHLDLVTFELKNLAGTNLVAVYEALAHTRFAHYSYLVCPRSRCRPAQNQEIHDACATHKLGLIFFEIPTQIFPPRTENFEIVLMPDRRTPDPFIVEEFIDARMTEENKEKLQELALTS